MAHPSFVCLGGDFRSQRCLTLVRVFADRSLPSAQPKGESVVTRTSHSNPGPTLSPKREGWGTRMFRSSV